MKTLTFAVDFFVMLWDTLTHGDPLGHLIAYLRVVNGDITPDTRVSPLEV